MMSLVVLKTLDTTVNYSKFVSIRTYLVTSNGELLIVGLYNIFGNGSLRVTYFSKKEVISRSNIKRLQA